LEIIKELYWIILLMGRYIRWCDINEMMCLSVKETWTWIFIGLWCCVGHVLRKFEKKILLCVYLHGRVIMMYGYASDLI